MTSPGSPRSRGPMPASNAIASTSSTLSAAIGAKASSTSFGAMPVHGGRRPVAGSSSSPPCRRAPMTGAGARDFAKKGGYMLRDALEFFEAGRQCAAWSGAPYYCENPVGVLSSVPHIGKPDFYFDPFEYAGYCADDWYTKKTCLWTGNGFVMPDPLYDRERYARGLVAKKHFDKTGEKLPDLADYPDNRIHFASPGDDRADVRSASPYGFNHAVFLANAPAEYRRIAA